MASVAPAFAQSGGGASGGRSSIPPCGQSGGRIQDNNAKAQRKAEQKQARAKKNAELKQLESNGYNPSRNDPNYPTDIQNAQKKAGVGRDGEPVTGSYARAFAKVFQRREATRSMK